MSHKNVPFLAAAGVLFLLLCIGVGYSKFHRRSDSLERKVVLTPSQQEVVNELHRAKAEADEARASVEKSKAEFQQMINDARATVIGANLNQTVQTTWMVHGANGSFAVANGKPVLFGFRADGLITWKAQDP